MARFHDWLNANSDAELPDELLTSLNEAYDEDMSIPAAKVSQLEADNAKLRESEQALKATNYDLLRASSGDAPNTKTANDANTEGDNPVTIASLFE